MSEFKSSLIEDYKQLEEKYKKLLFFLENNSHTVENKYHLAIMKIQCEAMATYLSCLKERHLLLLAESDSSNPPNGPGTPP